MFQSFANFQPFTALQQQSNPNQAVATNTPAPALASMATQPAAAPPATTSPTNQSAAFTSIKDALKQQLLGSITGNSAGGPQSALMQGLGQYLNGMDTSTAGQVINGMAGNSPGNGYGSQLMQGMNQQGAAQSAPDWGDSLMALFE